MSMGTKAYKPQSFPQELLDLIIDHLHDDFASLKQCSLVSSSWRPSSQFHLHGKATLQPKTLRVKSHVPGTGSEGSEGGDSISSDALWDRGYSRRIHFLLEAAPHLFQYARTLVIREGDSSWLQREPSLLSFLKTAARKGLRRVEIHNVDWRMINPYLQDALLAVLSLHTVREVGLVDCYLPSGVPWMKFIGPEARKFKLERVKIYASRSEGSQHPPSPPLLPSVTTLIISSFGQHTPRLVAWLLYPTSHSGLLLPHSRRSEGERHHKELRRIDSLEISCDRVSVRDISGLIQACPALMYLRFKPCLFRSDQRTNFPFPNITMNSSLQTLHLSGLWTDQFRWLTNELTRLSPSTDPSSSPPSPPFPSYFPLPNPANLTSLESVNIDMTAQLPVFVSSDEALYQKVRELDEAVKNVGGRGGVKGYFRLSFPGIKHGRNEGNEMKNLATRIQKFGDGLAAIQLDVVG